MTAPAAGSRDESTSSEVLDRAEFDRRIIEPDDFVADPSAFVDVRLPGSHGKDNYSMIGPGVSQNSAQTINLVEPHGFNVGAAGIPPGVVNNSHMHFTAEVFVCVRGTFRMFIGVDEDQELEVHPGDIISIPTWILRGFENVSDDHGWLYSVLGGDDTGGIVWSPHVLLAAADTGLYLRSDNTLVDTTAGDDASEAELMSPLSEVELAMLDDYDDATLADWVVTRANADFRMPSLLSGVIDGHDARLAPVIGYGMTEDRHHDPPLPRPRGFTVEWLRIDPGSRTGMHRHDGTQAILLVDAGWELSVNLHDDLLVRQPAAGTVASIPPGTWRDLHNPTTSTLEALVINGGDSRTHLDWHPDIVDEAWDRGWTRDAAGYLAPTRIVGT